MPKEVQIDLKKVDDLLTAGCSGLQIAGTFGCHEDTLYRRISDAYGMSFSAYAAKKRSKGEALIKAQQFAKALGLSKAGDNMMLIWLGKNMLGQLDSPIQKNPENEKVIDATLDNAKENARLRQENIRLKEALLDTGWKEVLVEGSTNSKELQSQEDKNEPETRTEHLRSEQTSEYMVRSSSFGEDIQ